MPLSKNKASLTILILIPLFSFSQSASDWQLIKQRNFHDEAYHEHKIKFITSESKSPFVKYNPVVWGLGGLLFFYQKVLSPQISSKCSYEISCSDFSKRCIQQFGLLKGVALSTDRLTRCTRLAALDIHFMDINQAKQKIIDHPTKYKLRP